MSVLSQPFTGSVPGVECLPTEMVPEIPHSGLGSYLKNTIHQNLKNRHSLVQDKMAKVTLFLKQLLLSVTFRELSYIPQGASQYM